MTVDPELPLENRSLIDPTRKTVGAMSIDAQAHGERGIEIGNIAEEMMKGLVEDINIAIKSNPFNDQPFYIQITEQKDLQMKNAFRRMVNKWIKRPWPEDGTDVFKHDPRAFITYFCWSIPHHSFMDNIIMNPELNHPDDVAEIKSWKSLELHCFGFMKDEWGNWVPNPLWKDIPIEEYFKRRSRKKIYTPVTSM